MQRFCNLHETVLCFTKQLHTQCKLVNNRKMSFLYLVYDKNIARISGIFQNIKGNAINIASTVSSIGKR